MSFAFDGNCAYDWYNLVLHSLGEGDYVEEAADV